MTSKFRTSFDNPWNPAIPCKAARQRARVYINYEERVKECNGCHKILDWEAFRPTEYGYPSPKCIPCHRDHTREYARRASGFYEGTK